MLQNIKVDIIYYLTASDFEMEFNLCGCCRMRLLSDKVDDKGEFVNGLARAVSRSRVVICCGPLFGENGLIKLVSAAISRPLSATDNNAYGIATNDEIEIIKDSVPLVTPDGIFGGCIIESGPQTLILLSESRGVRKSIMKNLLHPYIEEISMLSATVEHSNLGAHDAVEEEVAQPEVEEAAPQEEQTEEAEQITQVGDEEAQNEESDSKVGEPTSDESQQEITPEETVDETTAEEEVTEEVEEETEEEVEEVVAQKEDQEEAYTQEPQSEQTDIPTESFSEEEIGFLIDDKEEDSEEKSDVISPFANNQELGLYLEPQRISRKKVGDYAKDYRPSEKDEMFISDSDESKEEYIPRPININIPIIVVAVILALILAVLAYMLLYVPYSRGEDVSQYISNIFNTAGEASVRFKF